MVADKWTSPDLRMTNGEKRGRCHTKWVQCDVRHQNDTADAWLYWFIIYKNFLNFLRHRLLSKMMRTDRGAWRVRTRVHTEWISCINLHTKFMEKFIMLLISFSDCQVCILFGRHRRRRHPSRMEWLMADDGYSWVSLLPSDTFFMIC